MRKKSSRLAALSMILCSVALTALGCTVNAKHYTEVTSTLINKNASVNTRKLYKYLKDNYGKFTFSGQYINEYEDFNSDEFKVDGKRTVFKANELQAIKQATGKTPAILGLDLSELENGSERCYSIEQAIEWHNAGGISTICWHWCSPTTRAFYSENNSFSLEAALADKEGTEYKQLIADIDVISGALSELNELDIPVLWRPLHEASGAWFWWGNSGELAYKELWDIMYDRMTNHHELNNLIWVSNSQDKSWYVGDEKCDMIGDDVYTNTRENYDLDSALSERFMGNYKTTDTKMIALTENDFIPNVDAMLAKNTHWLMFANWAREFVCVIDKSSGYNRTTPDYNDTYLSVEEIFEIYNHERVLTLDEITENGYYYNK